MVGRCALTVDLRRYVRRTLTAFHGTRKDERVFPGFVSFEASEPPRWWHGGIAEPSWGEVYGVHESEPGRADGAVVIAENGLALLRPGGPMWVSYSSIKGWDQLSKEPPSTSLGVVTQAGERVELPFPGVGRAFAFVQFLGAAMDAHARAKKVRNGDV